MAQREDEARYKQSLESLLHRIETEEDLIDRWEALHVFAPHSAHRNNISVWDDLTSLLIYATDVTLFRCLDGNNENTGSHLYKHIVIDWHGRGLINSSCLLKIAIFVDAHEHPTIDRRPVKAFIVDQSEYSLELPDCKNLIINKFTDFKGKIFETDGRNRGLKLDDSVAVANGIFDIGRVVIDGKLDSINEGARLNDLQVNETEAAVDTLDDIMRDFNRRIYKKHWGEDKLVRDYHVVTRHLAGNGITYYDYVQDILKEACSQPPLSHTVIGQIPFSNCEQHTLGRFSTCVMDNLVPMFSINYVSLIFAAWHLQLAVRYDGPHTLYILYKHNIEAYSHYLTVEGNRVIRKRELASERRKLKPRPPRPRKKEDLSYEIEMN